MRVRVRLLGEFRRYLQGRAEPIVCEVADAAPVADLAACLGIDPSAEAIVGVNGQLGRMDSSLADGDEVIFVSPMSGGARARESETAGRDRAAFWPRPGRAKTRLEETSDG